MWLGTGFPDLLFKYCLLLRDTTSCGCKMANSFQYSGKKKSFLLTFRWSFQLTDISGHVPYRNQSQWSEEWYANKLRPSSCAQNWGWVSLLRVVWGRGRSWRSVSKRKRNDILDIPKQQVLAILCRDSSSRETQVMIVYSLSLLEMTFLLS